MKKILTGLAASCLGCFVAYGFVYLIEQTRVGKAELIFDIVDKSEIHSRGETEERIQELSKVDASAAMRLGEGLFVVAEKVKPAVLAEVLKQNPELFLSMISKESSTSAGVQVRQAVMASFAKRGIEGLKDYDLSRLDGCDVIDGIVFALVSVMKKFDLKMLREGNIGATEVFVSKISRYLEEARLDGIEISKKTGTALDLLVVRSFLAADVALGGIDSLRSVALSGDNERIAFVALELLKSKNVDQVVLELKNQFIGPALDVLVVKILDEYLDVGDLIGGDKTSGGWGHRRKIDSVSERVRFSADGLSRRFDYGYRDLSDRLEESVNFSRDLYTEKYMLSMEFAALLERSDLSIYYKSLAMTRWGAVDSSSALMWVDYRCNAVNRNLFKAYILSGAVGMDLDDFWEGLNRLDDSTMRKKVLETYCKNLVGRDDARLQEIMTYELYEGLEEVQKRSIEKCIERNKMLPLGGSSKPKL